jgi:formylglycine-generating enzyme required for sulfatase activity
MLELIQDLDAIEKGSASTKNLTELSTINSLRDELGEMDINRASSNKAVQSSKSNKTIVEKDYKFALIATGIGFVLSGIVALAFILGRSSNLQSELALKSNSANGKVEVVTRNDSTEGIPSKGNLLVAPFTEAEAKEVQKEVAKSLRKEVDEKEDLGKGIKLEMILIPAGKFMMGSPESEPGRQQNETQHEVTLTKPFYIGKYEVTQEQWEAVMESNPSSRIKGEKLPVTNVSWEDCQKFIKKVNASTKGGYRLPTEAEWEYACRAGTSTAYSVGDSLTKSEANIDNSMTKTVGNYMPNVFGLYDMHGNVWEWCEDWSAAYTGDGVTNPKGAATGTSRVLRGGSFLTAVSGARSSRRLIYSPSNRDFITGFRLAKTADVKAAVAPAISNPKPAVVMPTAGNLLVAPFTEAEAKEVQKEVAKSLQKEVDEKEDLGKGITLDMVLIPAGKFMMGSPITEVGRKNNETQHEVTITKPYYMGKYEVTQEQWESVMGANPSLSVKGSKFPVTDVSWDDCQEFIKKLNAKTKGSYRLPTEAEWEYACRAGTTMAYPFGEKITPMDANYIESGKAKPIATGSYKPNRFGLYDMHGNVWEWCEDWYRNYPAEFVVDPKGAATGTIRVLRGGSFTDNGSVVRSSTRGDDLRFTSSDRLFNRGFRLTRTVDVKTAIAPSVPKPDPAEIMPAAGNLLEAPFTEAKAKETQKEVAKSLQKEVEEKEDLGKGITLDLVLIPAGKFKMGDPGNDHEVTLTKPFYLGKYEVMQEQWESVMGSNPSSKTKGKKLPVKDVSWKDCQEFIKKLNDSTKGGYRLPSEAEWEYACRAGTITAYSVGDSLTQSDANYGELKGGSIKAVGSYKANAFGLYDMHGNVLEWCQDYYGDYPIGALTDPKGLAIGNVRVLRGGSFYQDFWNARSSLRNYALDRDLGYYTGFRLAKAP